MVGLIKVEKDPKRVWFTADNHFGHANIVNLCNRPFADVREMDAVMARNWWDAVGPTDLVFHLGDFCLGDQRTAASYWRRLSGQKHILGLPWHHDRRWLRGVVPDVKILPPMAVLEFPGLGQGKRPLIVHLSHYPLASWDRQHYGAIHLHGHSHGKMVTASNRLDVGVDVHEFRPVSLADVLRIMGR